MHLNHTYESNTGVTRGCSIFKCWVFTTIHGSVITIYYCYFLDQVKAWLSGLRFVLVYFNSREDVRWVVVFHVNVICFKAINEVRHLNSWFHWVWGFLEIWSSCYGWLGLEWVLLRRFKHVILHWTSWSLEYIYSRVVVLFKVSWLLLLWRLELLLSLIHATWILTSVVAILTWFSWLVNQWK